MVMYINTYGNQCQMFSPQFMRKTFAIQLEFSDKQEAYALSQKRKAQTSLNFIIHLSHFLAETDQIPFASK